MIEFLEKYIVLIGITIFMLALVFGLMWINIRRFRSSEPKQQKMRGDATESNSGLMEEDNFAETEEDDVAELLEPREKGTIRRFIKTGEGFVSPRPITKIIVNEKREEEQSQKRKPFYAPNTTDNSSEE